MRRAGRRKLVDYATFSYTTRHLTAFRVRNALRDVRKCSDARRIPTALPLKNAGLNKSGVIHLAPEKTIEILPGAKRIIETRLGLAKNHKPICWPNKSLNSTKLYIIKPIFKTNILPIFESSNIYIYISNQVS